MTHLKKMMRTDPANLELFDFIHELVKGAFSKYLNCRIIKNVVVEKPTLVIVQQPDQTKLSCTQPEFLDGLPR